MRAVLGERQRALAAAGSLVMEGRDIGTVVFPDAEHKFFLDADLAVRTDRRRSEEERDQGQVAAELAERDRRDTRRAAAPLVAAADAIRIDTTSLRFEEVVERVLAAVGRPPSA